MEFNKKQLQEHYKEISKECILTGYALPLLIRDYPIPKKYKLTNTEKEKYFRQTSQETKLKLYNMLKNRRTIELQILQEKNKEYKNISDFYNEELKTFIINYPHYKEIIRGEIE